MFMDLGPIDIDSICHPRVTMVRIIVGMFIITTIIINNIITTITIPIVSNSNGDDVLIRILWILMAHHSTWLLISKNRKTDPIGPSVSVPKAPPWQQPDALHWSVPLSWHARWHGLPAAAEHSLGGFQGKARSFSGLRSLKKKGNPSSTCLKVKQNHKISDFFQSLKKSRCKLNCLSFTLACPAAAAAMRGACPRGG